MRLTSYEDILAIKYVLALFLQTCFANGVLKCLGICLPDISVTLELTAMDTGIMFGLYRAALSCPGPVVAYLYHYNISRRVLVVCGAVFASIGIIFSSLSASSSFFIASVTLSGLGSGIISTVVIIGLSNAQPSRFSTNYGMGKSGYAVGMVVIPLLADFLLKVYGWRGALGIVGALIGNILPLVLSLDVDLKPEEEKGNGYSRCPSQDQGAETARERTSSGESAKSSNPSSSSALKASFGGTKVKDASDIKKYSFTSHIFGLWQKTLFYQDPCQNVVMLCSCVFSMISGCWYAFLIPRAMDRGISSSNALYLAFSAALASFLGRAFSGPASKHISPVDIFLAMTVVCIVSLLLDLLVFSYLVMLFSAFFTSLSISMNANLMTVVSRARSPLSHFPLL
ncbi:monocarboxylate transporter 12-B-like, partial [Diadema antillarum]|uniref:monocarboxylate transporter 12-B-like n=1 Tax=Diadema antillarum TaxID=105358 RepID=UPI003A84422B